MRKSAVYLIVITAAFSASAFADNASGTGEPNAIQALMDWLLSLVV